MTKGEETGTIIVVLLLVASVAVFAYSMGAYMGEQIVLSQSCAVECRVPESIR